MSLELRCGIIIKTGFDDVVHIDNLDIPFEDFADLVYYVLTNSDLEENDVRLKLIKVISEMKQVEGYNTKQFLMMIPSSSGTNLSRRLIYKNYPSLYPPLWNKVL